MSSCLVISRNTSSCFSSNSLSIVSQGFSQSAIMPHSLNPLFCFNTVLRARDRAARRMPTGPRAVVRAPLPSSARACSRARTSSRAFISIGRPWQSQPGTNCTLWPNILSDYPSVYERESAVCHTLLELCSANKIFQDFVHSMPDMEISIGVWRPIMEDKWLLFCSNLRLPGV